MNLWWKENRGGGQVQLLAWLFLKGLYIIPALLGPWVWAGGKLGVKGLALVAIGEPHTYYKPE